MSREKFKLELPRLEQSPTVSYSDLPKELLRSMGKSVGGLSIAERLAKSRSLEDLEMDDDAREWAEKRLFEATDKWQKFNDLLDVKMPNTSHELLELFPALAETLTQLYDTVVNDVDTAEEDSEILLVPYSDMLNRIKKLPEWLAQMRAIDGLSIDDIPQEINNRLGDADSILSYGSSNVNGGWSFKDQLEHDLIEGGDWGIHVVRTTKDVDLSLSSLRNLVDPSPSNRQFNFQTYGIAEWLADTMQRNPKNDRRILLTGSRIVAEHGNQVAYGHYDDVNNRYRLTLASESDNNYSDTDAVPIYRVT